MHTFILVTLTGVISKISRAETDTITCGTDIINLNTTYEDAFCYNVKDMDDLELYNDRSWSEGGIYFIDASCKGGLNVREACSVEAAANHNPTREVNVFFAGPIQVMCLTSEPLISLLTYHNVHVRRIYVNEFGKSCELDHLLTQTAITTGPHHNLYALELLKFITMHKFDGIYVDLDVMVTRPLIDLPEYANWLAIEDHNQGKLSSAIFAAAPDSVGRELMEAVVRVLKDNVTAWSLRDRSQSSHVLKMALEQRYGRIPFEAGAEGESFKQQDSLVLYASKFFFPVACKSSQVYFDPAPERRVPEAFAQRLCSEDTFRDVITEQSEYAQLMREHCPRVYQHFSKTTFGNN